MRVRLLPRPRRGSTLEDALVLRIVAIIRGLHAVAYTLLAIALVLLESNFVRIQRIGANLADKVSMPLVGALVLNLAILAWLVWSKRLFGLRGGTAALEAEAVRGASGTARRPPTSFDTETI